MDHTPKGRTHTPVRHHEIDRTGPIMSECKVYTLPPEELERYRSLPPPAQAITTTKILTTGKQRKMRRV